MPLSKAKPQEGVYNYKQYEFGEASVTYGKKQDEWRTPSFFKKFDYQPFGAEAKYKID